MTDGPDERLLGVEDTPGPAATPEQEAFVASLLGGLRDDDPPMPDDVVRRITGVLAEERRTAVATFGGPGPGSDGPDTTTARTLPDNVSVLPVRSDRPSGMTRSFRVLGGLAAATALVLGGVVLAKGGLGSNDSAGGSAAALPAAAQVRDSGTAYSKSSLSTQVSSLVADVPEARLGAVVVPETTPNDTGGTEGTSGSAAPTPATASASASADGGGVATTFSAAEVPSCLAGLERPGSRPLVVDRGTYSGRSAAVLVVATQDDATSLDVYVVALPCTASTAEILTFLRLPRP